MRGPADDDIWTHGSDLRAERAITRAYARLLAAHSGKILSWIALCVCFALAYGATARPEFIGVTQILLEPRLVARDGPEVVRAFHQIALDSEQAQTEQVAIQSPRVLRPVFDALQLAGSPELSPANDSYLTRVLRRWHAVRGFDGGSKVDRAFARFAARVRTRRLALSYIIEITYEAHSAGQAARVANAITSSYARDRLIRMASDALGGSAYHVAQGAEIRDEIAALARATAAGAIAHGASADANMRFLGPAVPPLRPAFPRLMPLIGLAIVFGSVTATLAVAILRNAGLSGGAGQQAVDRLGIECLATIGPARRRARGGAVDGSDVGRAVRRIWAHVAARIGAEPSLTVGFAAWNRDAVASVLAVELEAAMTRAGMRARLGGSVAERTEGGVVVTVLPPLAARPDAQAALRALDFVFLVFEADRTTLAEARAAVRLLGGVGTALAGVILVTPP